MFELDIKSHRPLREIVYEELKMQILRGTIVPGTRLMEVEMAEQMGVSRTPIREAIRKLEKDKYFFVIERKHLKKVSVSVIKTRAVLPGNKFIKPFVRN